MARRRTFHEVKTLFNTHFKKLEVVEEKVKNHKPPSVDSDVSRSSEPGVQDINTAHRVGSVQGLLESWIIMQPQTFAEPVHGIHNHDVLLTIH